MHEAATRNDVEALAALLDAEPGLVHALKFTEVSLVMWQNGSPLHFAASAGSMEAAQRLID